MKYGCGKQSQLNARIGEWMASGFTGSFYQEIVQRTEFKRLENAQKLMIWPRACKKLGGEQQAILALDKGELKAIQHPKDPDKILYCLEEITLTKGKEWTSTERSKLDFFFCKHTTDMGLSIYVYILYFASMLTPPCTSTPSAHYCDHVFFESI